MYVYTIKINDKEQQIVSLLAPEELNDRGLSSISILGTLSESNSQSINVDNVTTQAKKKRKISAPEAQSR